MLRLIGLLSYVYHNPLPSVADTPHFQLWRELLKYYSYATLFVGQKPMASY